MYINKDCGCIRAMNPDIGPGSSPGPDNTMALSGNEATLFNLILSAFTSSDMSLTIRYEPSCFYLPYHTVMVTTGFAPQAPHGPLFSPWSLGQTALGLLGNLFALLSPSCHWVETCFLLPYSTVIWQVLWDSLPSFFFSDFFMAFYVYNTKHPQLIQNVFYFAEIGITWFDKLNNINEHF